ncbi:hypothetical protein [Nonomuraea sp. NEAU-A123]|uniref:hypothetical protein n=1 Tax=Nonomuraea sp. NEAU-A123 TaxID=2839649 RepID=UPI001BE4AFB1|nr:hypothetical protein [Nonomuraea sp. NEAU-A123]MBT2226186.1 hypothetical protein [Nonomuraea sp. NEAU-A123]
MELDGASYSASRIKGLAGAMGDLADRLRGVEDRYETHKEAARKALGDDDYARAYWQVNGQRLEAIGAALKLLTQAAQREEERLGSASATYRATDDANG